jgi:hypothetical protein
MRTKWKLPVYFGALVLALTATVVSCSKDSTAPQSSASAGAHAAQQKSQDSQESSKWAGKYHTDGLTYVYSKLAQANKRGTKGEKCRVAIAALKEFDKSFRKDAKSTAFVSDDVCGAPGATGDLPQFGEESVSSFAGTGFSPAAASMLDEIRNVTNAHDSRSSVVSTVTGVQSSAAAKLNPAEAGAVTALGSVAISSAEYWDANADKWRGLSPIPGGIRKQINTSATDGSKSAGLFSRPRASISSDCCGGIASADITAFASALLQGWFLGPFDLEQAAYRATVASIIAALRWLL